jgi:hypothetical protein
MQYVRLFMLLLIGVSIAQKDGDPQVNAVAANASVAKPAATQPVQTPLENVGVLSNVEMQVRVPAHTPLGRPIPVHIRLTNRDPNRRLWYGTGSEALDFIPSVRGRGPDPVPQTEALKRMLTLQLDRGFEPNVSPGKEREGTLDLSQLFVFSRPGVYWLTVEAPCDFGDRPHVSYRVSINVEFTIDPVAN